MNLVSPTAAQLTRLLPASLRDDFPILSADLDHGQRLVFLDNAASTQRPRQVINAISRVYEQDYANVHRGIHTLSERSTELYEEARITIQRFIGAENPHECIFTSGTTGSINLVARSWGDANVGPGDEIILTVMEHHSNLVPWHQLAERTGVVLKHVPLTDDFRFDLEAYRQLLSEKTKLVAVCSVSNTIGTINPVAEITRLAHDAGALVLVDAAQSVPHMTTNVAADDVDFLAFSGHKMCGPSGVGILYGKEALLDAMPPFLGGGSMINQVRLDSFTPAELPAKFEAGTPPITPAIAMKAAADYLTEIGLEAIHEHESVLVGAAMDRLQEIEGLEILGPDRAHRAGLVSFTLEKIHAHEIAQVLNDQFGVAVRAGHHCTQPLHDLLGLSASTRASFYLYNTLDEVDQLVEGVAAVQKMFAPQGRKRKPRHAAG